jgi:hypothetical protein
MPPPMDMFSNFSDDFNPKATNVHEVSDEDKNANLEKNWKKMQRFKCRKNFKPLVMCAILMKKHSMTLWPMVLQP